MCIRDRCSPHTGVITSVFCASDFHSDPSITSTTRVETLPVYQSVSYTHLDVYKRQHEDDIRGECKKCPKKKASAIFLQHVYMKNETIM